MRYCPGCQRDVPAEGWATEDAPRCSGCRARSAREWRKRNKEWVREYDAKRRGQYAAALEPLERKCEICAEPFTPKRRDARTCSRECRSQLSYLYRKQRRLEAA